MNENHQTNGLNGTDRNLQIYWKLITTKFNPRVPLSLQSLSTEN